MDCHKNAIYDDVVYGWSPIYFDGQLNGTNDSSNFVENFSSVIKQNLSIELNHPKKVQSWNTVEDGIYHDWNCKFHKIFFTVLYDLFNFPLNLWHRNYEIFG